MSNEIRPEDIRRIAAAKERQVLGEDGIRRFADPSLDLSRGEALPRTPYGTQGHSVAPVAPRPPAARGPYDRNPRAAFDRVAPAAPPPPTYPPVYERAPLAADEMAQRDAGERSEPGDEDFGMPAAYTAPAFGRDDEYFDEAPKRRRRTLPMAVAGLALVGFAALVWYAYDWGSSGSVTGQAPVIAAAPGPDKVKPADEGGIQVPNQEATVLNPGAAKPTTEVLMPPPEEPVAAPPPAPPAPAAVTTTQPVEQPAVVLSPAPAPTPAAAPPSPPPATVTTAAVPVTGGATIAAGDFLIQLASLTSPEAAQKAWGKLQKDHPGLLGDMALSIQEADITGKGKYFRVQAGPLPNRATADDMCAQLKAQKQDCIVVKR